MSLPTSADLKTLNFDSYGQPFCQIPAQANINLLSIDYDSYGQPFVSNGITVPDYMAATGNIFKTWIKGLKR